jgi:hypothetical protein
MLTPYKLPANGSPANHPSDHYRLNLSKSVWIDYYYSLLRTTEVSIHLTPSEWKILAALHLALPDGIVPGELDWIVLNRLRGYPTNSLPVMLVRLRNKLEDVPGIWIETTQRPDGRTIYRLVITE